MKKRIVSLLMALVMMTSLLPVQVFAADVDAAAEQPAVEQQEQKQDEKQAEAPVKEPEQEAPAKAAEPARQEQTAQQEPAAENSTNGFVKDLKIQAAATVLTDIPGFTFDPAKTTYNNDDKLTLYNGIMPIIKASVTQTGLYFQVSVNGKSKAAPKAFSKTEDASIAGMDISSIVGASCGDNQFSIKIGLVSDDKKSFTTYDEYTFYYILKPTLTTPTLTDAGGNKISVSPEYKSGIWYFHDTFVAISSTDKVTFSGKFKTANTKCYLGAGNNSAEYTSGQKVELELASYREANSNIAKIPVRLVCDNGTENTSYFYIIDTEKAITITQQPQSTVCDKQDTPTLSIAATASGGTELSYQWFYDGAGGLGDNLKAIPGATNSTYTLPKSATQKANTLYYQCEVTSTLTIDGEPYTIKVKSDKVTVEVKLSYVSKPNIVRELGSFRSTNGENLFVADYKKEYTAGEKFDLMYISVEKPEKGVTLTYDYFYGTTPNDLVPLDVTFGQGWETTVGGTGFYEFITSARPTEGFEEGIYYIYCTVTATAEDGRTASETSGPVRLKYSRVTLTGFDGSGTKTDPYLIKTEDDLISLRNIVFNGQWCKGVHFKMVEDIALSADWTPIGEENEALKDPISGQKIQAFSGIFDGGGHKLTVAEGGKPLFNYVSDAVIENLDIYGKRIDGNGLIDRHFADYGDDGNYWTGVPDCVTIRNVRLLKGSSTRRSGFMEGSGSGKNNITIENCVVQKGVTVGYTHDEYSIGSFVGPMFNGQINNSYSEADVYGTSRMGGLVGSKGQSMGDCIVINSHFSGNLVASGEWVGGLIGGGYSSESAPNTMAVSFINCYVDGNVTGSDYVGGLFGGEEGMQQCWNECWLKDSHFYGTITASGDNVGGIIGYMRSIDNRQHIENNYFYETSGKELPLIGAVKRYDQSTDFGFGNDKAKLNAYLANMGSAKTEKEFKDGTVLALLNEGSDYKNWVQNVKYPTLSADPVVMGLTVSGEFKTKYQMGEALDLTGIRFKATWSDTTSQWLTLADVEQLDEFDPNHLGQQTITFQYGAGTASITVTVYKTYSDADKANFGKATVYFSLSEDGKFKDSGSTTLAGLETTVTYFDLADYGLEAYYCYDAQGNVIEKPTLLHLYIKMLEQYYLGGQKLTVGGKALALGGGAGSMYMTNFWGHDENLMYFVNHEYPLKADSDTIGETADQILLADGDVIEVAMYSDLNFYKDAAAGFPYFADAQGNAVDRCMLETGKELTLVLYRAPVTMGGGRAKPVIMPNTDVYAADQRTGDVSQWKKIGTTNDKGEIAVKFDEVGDQFLYVAGAVNAKNVAVGSPAICAVRVVEKIYNVTLPSGVKGDTTVAGGDDYIFRLDREDGYTYTVKATVDGKKADVIDNGDGTYTVKNVNGELKITVTKTANGNTGGNTGNKPSQPTTGKDVKSGNTGDAGITLYLGMGLVAVLAGAVIVTRKRKEN